MTKRNLYNKNKKDIVEMFERDARESGKRSSEILVGDELCEKIFPNKCGGEAE